MNTLWSTIALLVVFSAAIGGTTYWNALVVNTTYHQGWNDGFAAGQNAKMQHRIVPEPGKSAQPKG